MTTFVLSVMWCLAPHHILSRAFSRSVSLWDCVPCQHAYTCENLASACSYLSFVSPACTASFHSYRVSHTLCMYMCRLLVAWVLFNCLSGPCLQLLVIQFGLRWLKQLSLVPRWFLWLCLSLRSVFGIPIRCLYSLSHLCQAEVPSTPLTP